jgi:(p)ppGpp synthase/HD superfamily hydrolase
MKVLKAIKFAIEKHKGQIRRETNSPYVTHPIIVSYLLASYKKSKRMDDLLVAALLHDTLEDTNATIEEIQKHFGSLVSGIVYELTNDENEIKRLGKNEYLKQKMKGISSYALTIKLVDRLANISDNPRHKYVIDTVDLLIFIKKNRKLSLTQKNIVKDIEVECQKLILLQEEKLEVSM